MKRPLILFLILSFLAVSPTLQLAQATDYFADDFETGNMSKWTAMGGGIGFSMNSTIVHGGAYSIKSNDALGDGIYKNNIASVPTHCYYTAYMYFEGTATNAGDASTLSVYNSTSGRGFTVKHHTYLGGRDLFQLYDQWDGSAMNSTYDIVYDVWIKVTLEYWSTNNTAKIYVNDALVATDTMATSNQIMDEIDVDNDMATGYYTMFVDDVVVTDSAGSTPTYLVSTSSVPEVGANFTVNGTIYGTPYNVNVTAGNYTFQCSFTDYWLNTTHRYTFDHWLVNGTVESDSTTLTLAVSANSTLEMHYTVVRRSVDIPPIFIPPDSSYCFWYMRGDTHTKYGILGFRLWEQQSSTSFTDSVAISDTASTFYGVRVYIVDRRGYTTEITSGTPVAVVNRTSSGAGYQSATWNSPPDSMIVADAMMVTVYQRFNETGNWLLRNRFISRNELLFRLPQSTWNFTYYTNLTLGSANSTFIFGGSYMSSMGFYYYKANPFEVMTYRLGTQDLIQFVITPWSYYLGEQMFFGIVVLFLSGTLWNKYRSFELVLFLWFVFGGAGSVLSLLLPTSMLAICWVFLALALGITLLRLIR